MTVLETLARSLRLLICYCKQRRERKGLQLLRLVEAVTTDRCQNSCKFLSQGLLERVPELVCQFRPILISRRLDRDPN